MAHYLYLESNKIHGKIILMENQEYFKIRVNTLLPGRTTTFDLFVSIGSHYTLYLHAGDQLSERKLEHLIKKDTGVFYIRELDRKAYKEFIHQEMTSKDLSPREKAKVLRESSMTLVEELFENPNVNESVEEGKKAIDHFINLMEFEPDSLSHLIGLSSHDFYTYNHSVDVSIYALGLGMILGLKKDELSELGQGGIFHDVGKRHVSVDIICKPGPLNEIEWAQMKQHPQFGLMILNQQNVSHIVKACCLEHHENFNGNGYPQNIQGKEIHPMARIIAISDCFDALTTKRSYSQPMSPTQALNLMQEKMALKFDPEMLKAFYNVLKRMKIEENK